MTKLILLHACCCLIACSRYDGGLLGSWQTGIQGALGLDGGADYDAETRPDPVSGMHATGLADGGSCDGDDRDQPAPNCTRACERDDQCDRGAYCNEDACARVVPDGTTCERDAQCASGHCAGGICCGQGDCCTLAGDCGAVHSSAAVCFEPAQCQGIRGQASCDAFICRTQLIDDDSACAHSTIALDCGAFADVSCNGAEQQEPPACRGSCDAAADCDGDAYCSNSRCQPKRGNDAACSDGECCASDSDCASVYVCTDPTRCQGFVRERYCDLARSRCQERKQGASDGSGCVGQLARGCGPYRDVRCPLLPFAFVGECATHCGSNLDCSEGYRCEAEVCVPGSR